MRVLVVDDDPYLSKTLQISLENLGYTVDLAADGDKGSFYARTEIYDVIILDLTLPKKSGLEVCKEIRMADKPTPILLLSVTTEVASKVELLNAGADDFLSKPFSFMELEARIKALVRRPSNVTTDVLKIGNLVVHVSNQIVTRGRYKIQLTRKEFSLLELLMRHKGEVVPRGTIMEHVWNRESNPFTNTIEAHIFNLRQKIDGRFKKQLIHCLPGRGYKISLEK